MERKFGGGCKLWILFLIFTVGYVQSAVEYVETGTGHTFRPSVIGKPESILWKYNKNKLVEFDGGTTWYRFKGRGSLNQTGELQLQQLFKNESGLYQCDIQVSGRIQSTFYEVKVIDSVSTPAVKCEVNDENIKLTCSANLAEKLQFRGPDGFESTEATIIVPKGTDKKSVFICTAENELGSKAVKSTEFSLEKCSTGEGDSTAVIVIVIVLVIVIVISIAGFLYWRMKTNKGLQNITQEGNHLGAASTNVTPGEGDPLLSKEDKDVEKAEDEGPESTGENEEEAPITDSTSNKSAAGSNADLQNISQTNLTPGEEEPQLSKEDKDTEKAEEKDPEALSKSEEKAPLSHEVKDRLLEKQDSTSNKSTAGCKADGDQNLSTPPQNMSQPKYVGNDNTRVPPLAEKLKKFEDLQWKPKQLLTSKISQNGGASKQAQSDG